MEYQAHGPIHEECRIMINHVASYQMNISDAYLSMACYYGEGAEFPPFAVFFEQQAEEKREHAKQFLRFLRKREGEICLPVIQRPAMDNWGTGTQALKSALFLENVLNKMLQDLQTSASDTGEKDLFHFVGEFLEKQKKNINYLEYHLACMDQLEKSTEPSAECSGST